MKKFLLAAALITAALVAGFQQRAQACGHDCPCIILECTCTNIECK